MGTMKASVRVANARGWDGNAELNRERQLALRNAPPRSRRCIELRVPEKRTQTLTHDTRSDEQASNDLGDDDGLPDLVKEEGEDAREGDDDEGLHDEEDQGAVEGVKGAGSAVRVSVGRL